MSGPAAGALMIVVVLSLAAPRRPRPARTVGRTPEVVVALTESGPGHVPRTRVLLVTAGLLATAMAGSPLPVGAIALSAWLHARRRIARADRARQRAIADALPEVVDLLLLCVSAGHSLALSHPLVAERVPAPVGDALCAAAHEAARGRPRADALVDALSPFGDRASALAHALADHLRYGVPLAPTLERLGADLRLDRRRRGEQDARRVPVRLLMPLVVCELPAFALLTVVPLLAASLRALPT